MSAFVDHCRCDFGGPNHRPGVREVFLVTVIESFRHCQMNASESNCVKELEGIFWSLFGNTCLVAN